MIKVNNSYLYSPSDLIRYQNSPFASWMERYDLEYPGELERDPENRETQLIFDAGNEHEKAYLQILQESGQDLVEINRGKSSIEETKDAIQNKRGIIFQAAMQREHFRGYADFLMLNPEGEYEIWDTKLSRNMKSYYYVQLCCYAEMLEEITGKFPTCAGIILGNFTKQTVNLDDHFEDYLKIKNEFLTQMENWDSALPPDPLPNADHSDWSNAARKWMIKKDHLCLVASIRVSQIQKLNDAGITTVQQLASTPLASIPRLRQETFEALKNQAALQVETQKIRTSKGSNNVPPLFLVKSPTDSQNPKGLSALPPQTSEDIYFDLEGYPFFSGGLEYLWGASYHQGDEIAFKDWWAHDHEDEEHAFCAFIDWVKQKLTINPQMHIYHYAAYEKTALKRIACRLGDRARELDELISGGVFVDLYQVVKQGLIVGEESYSIKKIERLYRVARDGDVSTSMGSILAYADWLKSGEPDDWESSEILSSLRSYNRDDCESTWELARWLRDVQSSEGISYQSNPDEKAVPLSA